MILTVQANAAHLPLADESVHCCVCSPPYFGLRDYGLPPSVWGGDAGCAHEWGEERCDTVGNAPSEHTTMTGGMGIRASQSNASRGAFCSRCGAWRGCLGLEPDLRMYVEHLVTIFREVRRVLRSDGTFWLNLGDSFSGSGKGQMGNGEHAAKHGEKQHTNKGTLVGGLPAARSNGLKPKDLCMIPARVALALQDDGWWVRSDIIWAKGISFCPTYSGSCMPESVTDRPTSAHEHVFLLSKSSRYFYDAEAVREPGAEPDRKRNDAVYGANGAQVRHSPGGIMGASNTRNLRNVWAINPAGYRGAHFATWPPALVEPMILAGTSERGCCPHCGAPWERVVEKGEPVQQHWAPGTQEKIDQAQGRHGATSVMNTGFVAQNLTLGWRPTCACPEHEPVPCTVLDPFAGSGTTGMVAVHHRRRAVLVDLSGAYLRELATERTDGVAMRLPMPQMEG